MKKPIIDLSTLTEEQREAIKELHEGVVKTYIHRSHISFEGWLYILKTIFGEEIYKGESLVKKSIKENNKTTSEEIKKIVKEYALKHCSAYVTIGLIESIINGFTEQLSNDYCIVSKSKLQEFYKESKLRSESELKFDIITGNARVSLFETLFGTDLFNEEKG